MWLLFLSKVVPAPGIALLHDSMVPTQVSCMIPFIWRPPWVAHGISSHLLPPPNQAPVSGFYSTLPLRTCDTQKGLCATPALWFSGCDPALGGDGWRSSHVAQAGRGSDLCRGFLNPRCIRKATVLTRHNFNCCTIYNFL